MPHLDEARGLIKGLSNPSTAYDMLSTLTAAEIAVTGASTLTAGRMHACSGTTADYAVTLPSAAVAGVFVGIRMVPGLTRWVTVTAAGSDTIDGAATRKMWRNESAILLSTGTGWVKVGGKSIPVSLVLQRTTAQSIGASAWTAIQTLTLARDNTSTLAVPCGDLTNGRFLSARDSDYQCSGSVSMELVTSGKDIAGGVSIGNFPTDNPNAFNFVAAGASGNVQLTAGGVFRVGVSSTVSAIVYSTDTVSRNTRAVATVYPTLSVTEIASW